MTSMPLSTYNVLESFSSSEAANAVNASEHLRDKQGLLLEDLGFEHIELPAKLLDYFLQSNKNNINQLLSVCHLKCRSRCRSGHCSRCCGNG